MTYITSLDPNSIENERAQALWEHWDDYIPEWREMSIDPEKRSEVPADLISNAHFGFVRRYGNDDPGRYFPGIDGE